MLGVIIDHKLNWCTHVGEICKKVSRVIYLLRNLEKAVPSHYLRIAYFAFFQTVISYGLIIWGNSSKINDVFLIQKKAIRILTDSAYLAHCKPLFIEN